MAVWSRFDISNSRKSGKAYNEPLPVFNNREGLFTSYLPFFLLRTSWHPRTSGYTSIRLNRRLFVTTKTLLKAIANAASIGLR